MSNEEKKNIFYAFDTCYLVHLAFKCYPAYI